MEYTLTITHGLVAFVICAVAAYALVLIIVILAYSKKEKELVAEYENLKPADIEIAIPPVPKEPDEREHGPELEECYNCPYCSNEYQTYAMCPRRTFDGNQKEWGDYRAELARWDDKYSELTRAQYLKKILESASGA